MKRKDLVAGERYVTSAGVVFEVEDIDPGWRVVDGEWVFDQVVGTRYMPDKQAHVPYATNGAIRAWRLDHTSKGERTKVAIEPRILVRLAKEHEASQRVLATEAKDWQKATREINRLAKEKGFPNHFVIDTEARTATVSVDSLAARLGVEIPA